MTKPVTDEAQTPIRRGCSLPLWPVMSRLPIRPDLIDPVRQMGGRLEGRPRSGSFRLLDAAKRNFRSAMMAASLARVRTSGSKIPRMNSVPFDSVPFAPMLLAALLGLAQLAWYIGVIVLLYRIWGKVKHLG